MKLIAKASMTCAALVVAACGVGGAGRDEPLPSSAVPRADVTVAAEWVVFDTLRDLFATAELVVIGTVGEEVGTYAVRDDTGEHVLSRVIHSFSVEEVLLARPERTIVEPNDEIRVAYSDWGRPVENVSPLQRGERVLLALARDDSPAGVQAGAVFVPIQSDSGVFSVKDGLATARGVVGPLAGTTVELAEVRAVAVDAAAP